MKRILVVGLIGGIIAGCGSSGSSSPEPENQPPVASAGEDFSVNEQTPVDLSGNGSDSDGTVVSYQWTQVAGEAVVLEDASNSNASFQAPITTEQLVIGMRLTVTDNQSATHSDDVNIIVNPVNTSPVIETFSHPGVIETLDTQARILATDEDGEIVSYAWQQLAGTDVGLLPENATSDSITFTAPEVSVGELIIFEVTVTDNESATVTSEVSINLFDSKRVPKFEQLTDTGMLTCGNYGLSSDPDEIHANNLDCDLNESPATYPVPKGQDGHFGRDIADVDDSDGRASHRYLKLDAGGGILPKDSEHWSCLLDQITGLTWEMKTEGGSINANHNRFTWFNEDELINGGVSGEENDSVSCIFGAIDCNTHEYLEHQNNDFVCSTDNWRLPTPRELYSLLSLREGGITKIDSNFLPNIHTGHSSFWTSASNPSAPERAYIVDFQSASIEQADKANLHGILMVRSSQIAQ